MLPSHFIVSLFSLVLVALGSSTVAGQDYPSKPIRINTSGAGGGSDFISRQIAQAISGPLGQPVVVENRGTALVAAEVVSKSPPDGYTLMVQGSSLWIGPLLQNLRYDPIRDFSPISLVTREVSILAVHPSLPVKSVKELIALAKSRPDEVNFGTGAIGSALHLAAQQFKSMSATNIVVVPYKNNASQLTALLSGEVQVTILDARLLAPLGKAGKLRTLAVTSAEPTALVPDVPPIAATGLPGYEAVGMSGIFAPGKTPSGIINRLNQEVVRFLSTTEAKETFFKAGADVVPSSPERFAEIIKSDMTKTGKLINDVGIRVE